MQRWATVAAALSVLVFAACGGDDDEPTSGSGEAEVTTLRIGVLPIADVAPLYVGIEQGFFEEENLRIEPQVLLLEEALLDAEYRGATSAIGRTPIRSVV